MLEELQPGSAQERAEALNIAGLYVRRARLVELEALALQHATRTGPSGLPGLLGEPTDRDRERAGARALTPGLFERLPRYEGHLSESWPAASPATGGCRRSGSFRSGRCWGRSSRPQRASLTGLPEPLRHSRPLCAGGGALRGGA